MFYYCHIIFGLIPWTKIKITQFDVKTRKLLTAVYSHHPWSAVERIYLTQSAGGVGSINVENLFYRRVVSIACHLSTSTDSPVGICLKLDELLPARSALTSMAASHYASLSVPCDLWQCMCYL